MKIQKRTLLWIVIGIMFIAVLFLTFKTMTLSSTAIPAVKSAASSASSYGGMVGGC